MTRQERIDKRMEHLALIGGAMAQEQNLAPNSSLVPKSKIAAKMRTER